MGISVGIEVTRACNFTCGHCFVDAGAPLRGEPTTAQWCAILDQLKDLGADTVGWSGGEPLIRRDLSALTRHATGLGLRTGLATNGFLATPRRMRELHEAGLSVVQVSVDGADEPRAHRYRQGPRGAFDRALNAVRVAAAEGLSTYVCTILAPDTAGEVEEMVSLGRALGACGLRYTMWAPVGRAAGAAYDEAAWATPALRHFLTVAARHPHGSAWPILVDCPTGPLPGMGSYQCGAGRQTLYLTADGGVYPCTALMTADYLTGNLHDRPLSELVRSSRHRRVHRQRAALRVAGTCQGCEDLADCRGGCPGRTVAAFGALRGLRAGAAMPACLRRLHPAAT